LAAVLRYAALCIRLGGVLRKWFVTTVFTLPTCPATSWNFVRIFCDDSEAFFRVFQLVSPEVKYLCEENTWKNPHIIFI